MISFILLLPFFVSVFGEENILCTSDYCDKVKCPSLPEKCQIQNSTHNGIFLPSPDTCNCCKYCLENLNEGDPCSVGNPSLPITQKVCGPGLYCKLVPNSDYDGLCSKMDTECLRNQVSFDERKQNGTLGTMEVRQNCDDEGLFVPYKCIPGQSCYCVHKNGTRIFGESDFSALPDVQMQCKCSRDYAEAVEIIGKELNPNEHMRCTANGDYDTIQRIKDKYLCVDASDGAPTYPQDAMVNSSLIDKLKCYKKAEKEDVYLKKCEKEYVDILKEVELYDYDLVIGYEFPKCDIDGTYKPVQENATHKLCVDKEGTVLTAIDKVEKKHLADSMDCKCLRAIQVMTTNEKPICDENGNYAPIQCRRGQCRCVDSDGNQVCNNANCEVNDFEKSTLKC